MKISINYVYRASFEIDDLFTDDGTNNRYQTFVC